MEAIDKLRQEFLNQAHRGGPPAFFDAVVLDIDDEQYTCDVLLDDVELFGIRLRAVVSSNTSIDVLPAVGAQIVIGKLDDDNYIMVAADEITSYRITVGETVFTLTAAGVLISKGAETLNKILTDMVTGILTIAAPKDVPGITALKLRIANLLQ